MTWNALRWSSFFSCLVTGLALARLSSELRNPLLGYNHEHPATIEYKSEANSPSKNENENNDPDAIVRYKSEAKPANESPNKNEYKNKHKHDSKHDFSYDRERWERNSARFVVMAGPHKTASTTLQTFFEKIAHSTVSVLNANENTNTNATNQNFFTFETPHPAITDWVFPLGVNQEYNGKINSVTEFKRMGHPYKFYAALASFISGRRFGVYFQQFEKLGTEAEKENFRTGVADYFRSLFRTPWEEGKNIVIAAEAFDSLVWPLAGVENPLVGEGEELHVASSSSGMVDALLDLLPWDNANAPAASSDRNGNTNVNGNTRSSPLRMEDIEVQINLRTPKISHVISIWHQVASKKSSLKKFLSKPNSKSLYQSNSLGLALAYARKGIKTTIIDMAGVREKELRDSMERTKMNRLESNDIVGGLQGVVACDVLRMGKNNKNSNDNITAFCDDYSRLHIPGYVHKENNQNVKPDKHSRDVTEEQLQKIDAVLNKLDCSIWKHLKKYQASGTLRILYPSENLLATCDPEGIRDEDVSFRGSLLYIRNIFDEAIDVKFELLMENERRNYRKANKGSDGSR